MKDVSDRELVLQIAESNYAAYTALYDRYWKQLAKVALTKVAEEEDVYDIVQELFVDLWQRRGQLKIEKSIETYLISSLYYRVFMFFRKRGVEQKHLANYTYFLEDYDEGLEEDLEANYTDLIEMVAETIEEMPEKMRLIFSLKHQQSLSIREIADKLGISPQTVKNQLNNALTKLRKANDQRKSIHAVALMISMFLN